jgi:hypothetical protein
MGRPILPISRAALLAAALVAPLAGCGPLLSEGTGAAAGIGGASLAQSVGAGAAATTGIGLGVQAGAKAGLQYAQRQTREAAQLSVAKAAGMVGVGGVARWSIRHEVPIEPNESGEVTVTRLITAGGIACKEIVFSVDGPASRNFYTATVCRDGTVWRWASAEPATERWGALQ